MRTIAILMLQSAVPHPAPGWSLDTITRPLERALSATPGCAQAGEPDEVIVCAGRADRHRLPLPVARDDPTARRRGDAPGGLDALTPPTRCGIFSGERSCSKREAAAYGYGEGRDPVSVIGKLVARIADPDD